MIAASDGQQTRVTQNSARVAGLGLDSHSHSQVQYGGPVDTITIASQGVAWRVLCKL